MKLSELTERDISLAAANNRNFENWLPEWDDFRTFRVEILDTVRNWPTLFNLYHPSEE
jgi:hypothetical protein